ncbi:MAG: TonB-dependent receptor [Maribacter sp.]|nr:TonB-dependent receptor [Maribacter sp.]
MRTYFLISTYLILFFSGHQVYTQTTPIESPDIQNLEEVVVTAQFAPTSEKNAIYKVKVINRKVIEAKAATNLTELIRHELNIDLSYNSAFGAGIELQGISKENIKILVDGVPLIGRVNGVLNLNQINLGNIERIEIIEGPVSVFYGTDAMGGTINIITKKSQEKDVTGTISAYYESAEVRTLNSSFGFKSGKNLIMVDMGNYGFNGVNTDDSFIRSLNWPKKNQYYGNLKFIREIGDFKLRFSSDFSEEIVNTYGEVSTRSNTATDIDYATKRWDNSLNFHGKLENGNYLDVTASYLNYDRFDTSYLFDPANNSSELILDNPNENANYFNTFFTRANFAINDPSKKFNYLVGVEFESDHARGNRILDSKQDVQNTSVFSSINYKVSDSFEIQPALRYTYNSSFNSLLSPALNLKYRFNDNHVLRFAYGNGYRAPSIKELYLDWTPTFGPLTYIFTGNENLEVESSHNYNFYYTYKKNLTDDSYIKIEPSFFYNAIKNLIGLSELVNFERHYINLNQTKSLSTSLDIQYKVVENFQVNLGFSYLGRYLEYTDVFNSDTFLFTPYANASVSYTYNPYELSFTAFYKYSGKRKGHYIEEVNVVQELRGSTRDDFSNLDLALTKSLFKNKLALSIGAKNLFDVTDVETFNQIGAAHERDIQLWGATYYVRSKFTF